MAPQCGCCAEIQQLPDFFCRLEMRCINTDIVAAQPRRHPGRPDHPAARAKGVILGGVVAVPRDNLS